jgi:hypothetical protein
VGIFTGAKKGTDTTGLYFRYDYFDEARTRGKGLIGWIGVRVQNPDQAAEIAKRIDDDFANSPYETKTETEGAMAKGLRAAGRRYWHNYDRRLERRILYDPPRGGKYDEPGCARADGRNRGDESDGLYK